MEKPKVNETYNITSNTALQQYCKTFHCKKKTEETKSKVQNKGIVYFTKYSLNLILLMNCLQKYLSNY